MPSFSDIKKSFSLQRQAKKIQAELKNIHVEAEAPGVRVTVSAAMEVVSVEFLPAADLSLVGPALTDALNRALKKAQLVSAERMQGLMSQMGMTGAA